MATTFSTAVNNYFGLALSNRSIGGTSLVVSSTSSLPALSGSQYFRLSVFRNNVPIVILKVTGVNQSTNTLTIAGALEGPDAAVSANDVVMIADTAGDFTEIQSAVNNIETGTTNLPVLSTGSSVARTLNTRFSEIYDVLDWGVTGNGVTDDAPAINALINHVATQPSFIPRTIYFPAGNYAVNSPIYVARSLGTGVQTSAIHIVGDGYQTQFFSKNPAGITEVIRIEDSATGIFERFRILCQNPVTVAALHITAIASGENNNFHEITIDCNNSCPVGIGVSLDSDADTAQIQFYGCKVSNSTKAGIMLGNGTSGNVLDIRFLHCQSLHNPVGVWMDAAPIIWSGGATTTNSISDFFMSGGSGGPIVIEGVRSENSNMFFLSRGGGDIPPIRISDVQCSDFGGVTQIYTDATQTFVPSITEGFVISHRFSGVITIMNCSFWRGPSSYPGGRLNVSSDCHVAVINCELGTAGWTANSMRAGLYAAGGTSGKLNFTAIGGKTVTSGGTQYLSPIDILCDGPAFFNNTVALNTMAPTAGFHQVGGSFYLQKIPDPVTPPSVTNTGGGSTPYTYYYAYVDEVGNQTLVSPGGSTTGAVTLDANHYNTVVVPDPGVNIAGVDILRGDTGHSVATNWDPYVSSPTFTYIDTSPGTSSYSTPVRNATADMTVDGSINIGDASAFTVLTTGSTTARTLAARFTNQFFNVLDWGVTGNGVTDDQPAIMALLKYVSNLSSNTGFRRTIYFPAGSYNIGSATNSQGIMVAKRFMQKPDLTYPGAGSPWTGINFIGEGYSTQLISNCPTGLTEILRMEDTGISRVQGFRLWVHPLMPVTTAALHITAIAGGENHVIEDVTVEVQNQAAYAVSVTNGQTPVTGTGFTSTLVGKNLSFAGDSTHGTYQIQAYNSPTSITLATVYGGTTGNTTATVTATGDGCPVGIGISVDYNNDTAQVHLNGCKVSGADYAGFMFGGSTVGNVLDIRCKNCQSVNNPIGVFGWAAPIVWQSGITSFNYIADFYMNGPAGGPTLVDSVRSEGSNQFYKNNGGGTSTSPTTLSNCTISFWSGFTYAVNLNAAPPFYPMNVSVSNATPAVVTGTTTFFQSHGPVASGSKVVFQNDPTGTVYTVSTISSDTQLTLTTAYSGATGVSTFMGIAAPSFSLNTQASVTGTTVVSTINGSAIVTSTSSWTGSLTTSMYLVFANDPNQYAYSIKTIDSSTQVTLNTNAKGNTVYIGPTGLTTVKCGLVEGYALVDRSGGVFNLFGLMFSHSPAPYFYARWNFSATQCYVNAIGCSAGAATSTLSAMRDAQFFSGGVNPSGSNYMVLPGPGNTTGGSLFENDLGFLCGYQANFQKPISVGSFLVNPTAGYHQQGGSMRLQSVPNPGSAPTVAVQGSTGSTNYYYRFVFRDQAGNVTMSSPSSAHVTTSLPNTSFTTSNFNKITIPYTYQTSNPSYVDIIRTTGDGTDGASWVNVVNTNVSGSIQFGSTWSWNPWVTNAPNTSQIIFNDESTATPVAYTLPTRNLTADFTVDGNLITTGGITLDATYPGSGGTETNGSQTASITDATTQKMVQTLWNMARNKGLVA